MTTKFELKPYPFYGNKTSKIESNGIGDFYVICRENRYEQYEGCGVRTSDVMCEGVEYAAERWNRRA